MRFLQKVLIVLETLQRTGQKHRRVPCEKCGEPSNPLFTIHATVGTHFLCGDCYRSLHREFP